MGAEEVEEFVEMGAEEAEELVEMGVEEVEKQFEVNDDISEVQNMVPMEDRIDYAHSIRDKEVAPQSPETQIGDWVHKNPELAGKNLSPPLPTHDQVEREVTIESSHGAGIADVRADLVDWKNDGVGEIKPNNEAAIAKGQGQLEVEAGRLEEAYGRKFEPQLHTYDRDQVVKDNSWMKAAYPVEKTEVTDLSTTFKPADTDNFCSDLSTNYIVSGTADHPVDLSTNLSPNLETSVDTSADTSIGLNGFDSGGFDGKKM